MGPSTVNKNIYLTDSTNGRIWAINQKTNNNFSIGHYDGGSWTSPIPFTIDTAGNVGIGTATPSNTLSVAGNMNLKNEGLLSFGTAAASASNFALYGDTAGTVLNGPLGGVVGLNINNSRVLTVSGSNVGIGTTNPATKLDVSGTINVTVDGFHNNQIAMSGADAYHSWYGGDLVFYGNAAERMRVDTIGNVGIGTTYPAQTLSVSGTASFSSATAVGMSATPSATLDVSGSLKLAGTGNESCDGNRRGTLRIHPGSGKLEICRE